MITVIFSASARAAQTRAESGGDPPAPMAPAVSSPTAGAVLRPQRQQSLHTAAGACIWGRPGPLAPAACWRSPGPLPPPASPPFSLVMAPAEASSSTRGRVVVGHPNMAPAGRGGEPAGAAHTDQHESDDDFPQWLDPSSLPWRGGGLMSRRRVSSVQAVRALGDYPIQP